MSDSVLAGTTSDFSRDEVSAFDLDRIEAVASALDLRKPNKEALESIVFEVVQHYEIDKRPAPFEAVVDAATGVGKTFILAASIEYFAGQGIRDFAVITPGRTILEKTVANFTAGAPKSLLGGMSVAPVVITSENFNTAAMREAMDDEQQVKLYIFTVQSLIKPQTKAGRKTHKFQEGLGGAFYEHLQGRDDLFVFADEHHAYYGDAFSTAVRDLDPHVLIGLTATPHRNTPDELIIYRYPLAAAIADKLVKTPVLVGRKDDRTEPETKLADGVALLELKDETVARYCTATGADPVQPVMLVIAPDIGEAEEIERILQSQEFAEGRYAEKVLTVHSKQSDEALAKLAKLEEPGSPYRIVVSVGMLKEGWDVKSVYVICSLRASVSDLLTEQTLGRGLRLPFGAYTDIEILDSLEVLAHERYEQLLKKAGVINEQFVDRRTRAVLRQNAAGQLVSTVETTEVSAPVAVPDESGDTPALDPNQGQATVSSIESQKAQGEQDLQALAEELPRRSDLPSLRIPRLKMTPIESTFSLADITELAPFRALGNRISTDPEDELRRTAISAKIIEGPDGLRRTELVTSPAVDRVSSQATLRPFDELRERLLEQLLASSVVPARRKERAAAAPIVDEFIAGLGDKAQEILSAFFDRASGSLISQVVIEQRRVAAKPRYEQVVEVIDFGPLRHGKPTKSNDRTGPFKRGTTYSYKKSLYTEDWFDSSTERTVANLLDEADEVQYFVRLQNGDLPVLWAEGRNYNPDFVVVDADRVHYVIEVKMDKEMDSDIVQGKRGAARRWANHVSADEKVDEAWRYLLCSETDIKTAKGSWTALMQLAS
jgi:type III restriction enzyme